MQNVSKCRAHWYRNSNNFRVNNSCLTNSMRKEMLIVAQHAKQPASYRKESFVTIFNNNPPPLWIINQIISVHVLKTNRQNIIWNVSHLGLRLWSYFSQSALQTKTLYVFCILSTWSLRSRTPHSPLFFTLIIPAKNRSTINAKQPTN